MTNGRRRFLRVGTRTSRLARWQTQRVVGWLATVEGCAGVETISFETTGDRDRCTPLQKMQREGVFTGEIEEALRSGVIDIAVHSLKDLAAEDPDDLFLAVPERADVRDTLVGRNGWTLRTLPHRATVGTCSLRRAEQLLGLRPDLTVTPIRGDVEDRVRRVFAGDYDATVLAAAGLDRLGMGAVISQHFEVDELMPAPAQAALAVQCRAVDGYVVSLLSAIDDPAVRACVTAERTLLAQLGRVTSPVGGYAMIHERGVLTLHSRVVLRHGTVRVERTDQGRDPVELGRLAAAGIAASMSALPHNDGKSDEPAKRNIGIAA